MPFLSPLGAQVGDLTEAGQRLEIVSTIKANLDIIGKEVRIEAIFKSEHILINIIADTQGQHVEFDGSLIDAPVPLLQRLVAYSVTRALWTLTREGYITVVTLSDPRNYGPRDRTYIEMSEKAKVITKYIVPADKQQYAFTVLSERNVTFLSKEGRLYVRFPGLATKHMFEHAFAIQANTVVDEVDRKARIPFDDDVSDLYDDM